MGPASLSGLGGSPPRAFCPGCPPPVPTEPLEGSGRRVAPGGEPELPRGRCVASVRKADLQLRARSPRATPASASPQDLLDPARWRMLIQQFRYDNYRLHQLGNNSVFTLTLQAGLSAIKTPYPSGLTPPPVRGPSPVLSRGGAGRPRPRAALLRGRAGP